MRECFGPLDKLMFCILCISAFCFLCHWCTASNEYQSLDTLIDVELPKVLQEGDYLVREVNTHKVKHKSKLHEK